MLVLFLLPTFLVFCSGTKDEYGNIVYEGPFKGVPTYKYEQSYREYEYKTLSPAVQEVFFAGEIHPSCRAKFGICIPRNKCVGKKILYLSRGCYKKDLVCCYDDYPPIHTPVVRPKTVAANDTAAALRSKGSPLKFGANDENSNVSVALSNSTAQSLEVSQINLDPKAATSTSLFPVSSLKNELALSVNLTNGIDMTNHTSVQYRVDKTNSLEEDITTNEENLTEDNTSADTTSKAESY